MNNIRLDALRKLMQAQHLDAFILNEKANRYYLTGFTGSYGEALIAKNEQFIVTDGRYFEQLKTQSPDFTVVDNHMRMVETLNQLIAEKGYQRIGVEAEYMNVAEYLGLQASQVTLVPTSDIVESLRMIKDNQEQRAIQKAGAIADETYQ